MSIQSTSSISIPSYTIVSHDPQVNTQQLFNLFNSVWDEVEKNCSQMTCAINLNTRTIQSFSHIPTPSDASVDALSRLLKHLTDSNFSIDNKKLFEELTKDTAPHTPKETFVQLIVTAFCLREQSGKLSENVQEMGPYVMKFVLFSHTAKPDLSKLSEKLRCGTLPEVLLNAPRSVTQALRMIYLINPTLPLAYMGGDRESMFEKSQYRYLQEIFKMLPKEAQALLNTSCTLETFTSVLLTFAESIDKGEATETMATSLNGFYCNVFGVAEIDEIIESISKEKLNALLARIDTLLPPEEAKLNNFNV